MGKQGLLIACLTCSHANMPCVLTCSSAKVHCVLMCLRANVQHALHAHVPTCLACLRAHVPLPCVLCVSTCSRVITTNDKGKSSITCFPYILRLFFIFFLWNKTVAHSCVSLTSQKSLTGAVTNFVQWNGLSFVWTLRVIFKWLIKVERCIIMYGS